MKLGKIAGITVVIVFGLAILGVGLAFAQVSNRAPWSSFGPGGMMGNGWNGNGMMGGYGQGGIGAGWMEDMHQWMTETGGLHTLVWDSLANTLGLPPEELNAELSSDKTLAQVAEEQGVSLEELSTTWERAVQVGLERAVADGALTQEQADSMKAYMTGNYAWMLTQMGSHMGAGSTFGPDGCHSGNFPQGNS